MIFDFINNILYAVYEWIFTFYTNEKPNVFVRFFYTTDRNTSESDIHDLVDEMMFEDEDKAANALLCVRDPRNGTIGQRQVFLTAYAYMYMTYPYAWRVLIKQLWKIPEVGRWKDLVELYHRIDDKQFRDEVLEYFDSTLVSDREILSPCDPSVAVTHDPSVSSPAVTHDPSVSSPAVTQCAKWVPSEGKQYSGFTRDLAKYMQISMADLRKQYLSPLRRAIDIVESHLSCDAIHTIDYTNIPKIARKRYSFLNAQPLEQWNESLTDMCKYYLRFPQKHEGIEYQAREARKVIDTQRKVYYSLQCITPSSLTLGIFGSRGTLCVGNGMHLLYNSLYENIRDIARYENFTNDIYSLLTQSLPRGIETFVVVTDEDIPSNFYDRLEEARNWWWYWRNEQLPSIVWWNVQGCDEIDIDENNNVVFVRGNHPYLLYSFLENGFITRESYLEYLLE